MAYVHGRGDIHRDVKPANVLLDQHGRPHLSDFGIATVVDSTQITSTGMMIGTAAYLAPEQVHGHPVGPGAMSTPSVWCSWSASLAAGCTDDPRFPRDCPPR